MTGEGSNSGRKRDRAEPQIKIAKVKTKKSQIKQKVTSRLWWWWWCNYLDFLECSSKYNVIVVVLIRKNEKIIFSLLSTFLSRHLARYEGTGKKAKRSKLFTFTIGSGVRLALMPSQDSNEKWFYPAPD